MKKCPFCAEDIQDAAVVCKHCQRDLNSPDSAGQGVSNPEQAAPSAERESGTTEGEVVARPPSRWRWLWWLSGTTAAGFALWAVLLQTPLAVPLGLKNLADHYLDGCRTGDITSDVLAADTSAGDPLSDALASANRSLRYLEVSEKYRFSGRDAALECPVPALFGKILSTTRLSRRHVEWPTSRESKLVTDDDRFGLKIYQELLKTGESQTGLVPVNDSRVVGVVVTGDVMTLTQKIGVYYAEYKVELERGFLFVNIVYNSEYVYMVNFHK